MERRDPVIRWTGPVVRPITYAEGLQRQADLRWMTIVTGWLQRHGDAEDAQSPKPKKGLVLRGVRGLTPDGEPRHLGSLVRWIYRA